MYIYTYIQRCQVAAWKTTRLPTISNNSSSLFFNQPLLEASAAACCVHDKLIEYFYNNNWYDFKLTKKLYEQYRICSVHIVPFLLFFSVPSLSSSTQSGRSSRSVAFPQLIRQLVIITIVSSNNCVDEPRLGPTRISLRVIWSLILLDTLIERWCNNFDSIYYDHSRNCPKFADNVTKILYNWKDTNYVSTYIRHLWYYSDPILPELFRSIRILPIHPNFSDSFRSLEWFSTGRASIEKAV